MALCEKSSNIYLLAFNTEVQENKKSQSLWVVSS